MMNKWLMISILSILIALSQTGAYASTEERVLYSVEWKSDHSAEISLYHKEDSDHSLMITSWSFDDELLVVRYQSHSDVPEGFDQRLIENESIQFPLRIHLEEAQPRTDGPVFSDLVIEGETYDSIMHLYALGVLNGYPDGTIRKESTVSRAEFAIMLFKAADYAAVETEESFQDVGRQHWAYDSIQSLASKGILNGKGEGIFDPGGAIKYGEVFAVMDRTFQISSQEESYPYSLEDHWSNPLFLNLVKTGIIKPDDKIYKSYQPEALATREDCSIFLSRILATYNTPK